MSFETLLHEHVGAAFDRQLRLLDVIGNAAWNLDIPAGSVSFSSATVTRRSEVQILGTESTDDQTWLWAWANEASNLPANVVDAAKKIRAVGIEKGIVELAKAEQSLRSISGHVLALVASGMLELPGYYRGPYDGGAVFMALGDRTLLSEVKRPVERIGSVFSQLIAQVPISDHCAAFRSYVASYGLELSVDSTSKLVARDRGGDLVEAEFDDQSRLSRLQVCLERK